MKLMSLVVFLSVVRVRCVLPSSSVNTALSVLLCLFFLTSFEVLHIYSYTFNGFDSLIQKKVN